MYFKVHCPYCMKDAFEESGETTLQFYFDRRQLTDSGIQELTCKKGHDFTVIYSAAKFEVLFDIGMSAIRDCYSREGVSSFSSSLERFYEFYIRYVFHKKEISGSIFDNTWRAVSNQSERQLGAFLFIYFLLNHKEPTLLKNDEVKFRNSVIHKGYIPTKEEALKFGKSVYNLIMSIVRELEIASKKSLHDFYRTQVPSGGKSNWIIQESSRAICLTRSRDGTCDLGFEHALELFFNRPA
jgi:hypothetical protein